MSLLTEVRTHLMDLASGAWSAARSDNGFLATALRLYDSGSATFRRATCDSNGRQAVGLYADDSGTPRPVSCDSTGRVNTSRDSHMYGWDGASWEPIDTDGSNNLRTVLGPRHTLIKPQTSESVTVETSAQYITEVLKTTVPAQGIFLVEKGGVNITSLYCTWRVGYDSSMGSGEYYQWEVDLGPLGKNEVMFLPYPGCPAIAINENGISANRVNTPSYAYWTLGLAHHGESSDTLVAVEVCAPTNQST